MSKAEKIFLIIVFGLLNAGFLVQINAFTATFEGLDIKLSWQIADDSSVKRFDIYRKDGGESEYRKIATMLPQNTQSYYFIDSNLYKNEGDEGVIYYKLVAVANNANTSFFASVHHNPTAIQRSWGSIKAMFR